MMTDRLYYDDAYLREFDAHVICAREENWVALDRSAFYPLSGGQPCDTGILEAGEKTVRVLEAVVRQDVVWHRLDAPLREGQRVHGRIDWARRFDHMQQHAADHMLAGAAWELFGGVTIGLHVGQESSSIDMELPGGRMRLSETEAETLEALVNARVQKDDLIRCWFPSPRELEGLPLRKRPTVSEHVRVVAMGDYEMVACSGTHPSTTGQIGPVHILSCAPARGKMRLTFVSGMRAVRFLQRACRCAQTLCAALSSDIDGAAEALARERENALAARRDLTDRLTQSALQIARAQRQGELYACHLPFATPDILLRAARELTAAPQAAALLSCPHGEARQLVFARGEAVEQDMPALLRLSGARGGGRPELAQGVAPDSAALERAQELFVPHTKEEIV